MKRVFLVGALIVLSALASAAQTIQVNKDNRTIAITTSDNAETFADVAVVTIGFNVYAVDQARAYAEGSRVSNAVMAALRDAGVSTEAIESASQSLNAIDSNDKIHVAKGLAFAFSQSWRVTVPAKTAAGILHVAILAGANDSGEVQWKLAQEDALEAEAAGKALTHAGQIAARMAEGLHAKLGALIYASNQTPPRGSFGMLGGTLQTEAASVSSARINLKPLAISPQKIQRSATVYAVFAIE